MKTLFFDGREFQYEIETYMGEFGTFEVTVFYDGCETYTRKKYFFFGDTIQISKPIEVFRINANIESEFYTKSEVKAWISKKVELLNRKKEIENGQII